MVTLTHAYKSTHEAETAIERLLLPPVCRRSESS